MPWNPPSLDRQVVKLGVWPWPSLELRPSRQTPVDGVLKANVSGRCFTDRTVPTMPSWNDRILCFLCFCTTQMRPSSQCCNVGGDERHSLCRRSLPGDHSLSSSSSPGLYSSSERAVFFDFPSPPLVLSVPHRWLLVSSSEDSASWLCFPFPFLFTIYVYPRLETSWTVGRDGPA